MHGIAALSAAALTAAGLAGPAVGADECTDEECLTENVTLNFIQQAMEAQGVPQATIDQVMPIIKQMGLMDGGAGNFGDLQQLMMAFGAEGFPEQALAQLEGADFEDLLTKGEVDLDFKFASDGGEDTLIKWDPMDAEALVTLFMKAMPAELPPETLAQIPPQALAQLAELYAQAGILQPGEDLDDLLTKISDDLDADAFVKIDTLTEELEGAFQKHESGGAEFLVNDVSVDAAIAVLSQALADGDQATREALQALLEE